MARQVVLIFNLEEDVTPDLFARRVAEACVRYSALREGEAVEVANDGHIFTYEYVLAYLRTESSSLDAILGKEVTDVLAKYRPDILKEVEQDVSSE